MEQQQQQPPQQPQQQQQPQSQQHASQQQPQVGGVPGPAGRRLHIAHRRSPSELTPLMSMFANPGSKS
jgi:protein SSD1